MMLFVLLIFRSYFCVYSLIIRGSISHDSLWVQNIISSPIQFNIKGNLNTNSAFLVEACLTVADVW